MVRTCVLALAGILCWNTFAQAATQIVVGNHLLLPNTPNQKIDIFVTGGDQIQGINLLAQIGFIDPDDQFNTSGAPVFQYLAGSRFSYPGPNVSTLLSPGSILAAADFESDVTFSANLLVTTATFVSSGPVQATEANGLLAVLYVDTTGFLSGSWALNLYDTIVGPTDWAGSVFNGQEVPNPLIIDGSITIVPEPSSIALAAFAAAGLCAVATRRRAIRRRSPFDLV